MQIKRWRQIRDSQAAADRGGHTVADFVCVKQRQHFSFGFGE